MQQLDDMHRRIKLHLVNALMCHQVQSWALRLCLLYQQHGVCPHLHWHLQQASAAAGVPLCGAMRRQPDLR